MKGGDGGNDGGGKGYDRAPQGRRDPARERAPAQRNTGDQVRELPGRFPEEKEREGRVGVAERRRHPRGNSSPEKRKKGFGELGAELGEVQRG